MLLVELALQSVRGFGPQARIPLKPGINVAKTADAAQRAALIDAIYHTLYPDPSRATATSALAEGKESRIALTFYGRDKNTYRLLRDVENGATRLLKFDPEQKKYGMFAESTLEAAQYVRVQQQLPDEVSFERLFLFAPESMPGRGPKARTRSGAAVLSSGGTSDIAPSGPGLGRFAPPAPKPRAGSLSQRPQPRGASSPGRQPSLPPSNFGMPNALDQPAPADSEELEFEGEALPKKAPQVNPEEKLRDLALQRRELLNAQRSEAAQAELDHLNLTKVELTEKAERVVRLRQELERHKKEAPDDARLEALPPGFDQRLRDFDALEAKFSAEQARIQDEIINFETIDEKSYVRPLHKDPYFVAGVLGAGLMIFLAVSFEKPAIALANVLGVMVAAGAAFHWVAMLEEKAKMSVRTLAAKERMQRLEKQRSLDTGVTRRLMQELEVDSPASMLERVTAFQSSRTHIAQGEAKLAQLVADPELRRAEEELRGITARIESLEAEVLGASSTHSAETLEKRVRQMERELEAAGLKVPPRPAAPAPAPVAKRSPATRASGTGDLKLSTDDLPQSSPAPAAARAAAPRSASIVEFAPPQGEPLLRSPTLTGLPAWPPPGVESPSSDISFGGSGKSTPAHVAAPRGASLVGKPVAPPPPKPRSPSIPGGTDRRTPVPEAGPKRPSSVPGVLAPRRVFEAPAKPATAPAPAPKPAPAKRDTSFDFSGGMLGGDDDENAEGYGSGYGAGGGGGSDDEKKAPLEEGLLAAGIGGAGTGFRGGGTGGYGDDSTPIEPDRSRDLMHAAVDLLQQDVDSLAKSIESRLGQYLMAFTDKRFQTPTFGARGEVSVTSSDGGDPVPYMELDDELIDLVDASIRFSLVEAVLRKVRVPMLFDDPFRAFPARRRKLLTQMIGYLGGATQILIATEADDLTGNELKW